VSKPISNPTPTIPPSWQNYIKRAADKAAFGMFGPDDAQQVASIAFMSARRRYDGAKGPFENYAKVAIRRALVKARAAEQRHWHGREDPDDDRLHEVGLDVSAEEDSRLEAIASADKARAIDRWRPSLPPKLATVCSELYFQDRSQRSLATTEGVSQPRISQRNADLLARARMALGHLKE